MINLKQFIEHQYGARRPSRPRAARRHMGENAGDVSVASALGFDAASAALPADVNFDDRAASMNAFREKLIDYPHRDVLVVALAVGDER